MRRPCFGATVGLSIRRRHAGTGLLDLGSRLPGRDIGRVWEVMSVVGWGGVGLKGEGFVAQFVRFVRTVHAR